MRYILLASVVLGLVFLAIFASSEAVSLTLVLAAFSLDTLVVIGFIAYSMDFDRLYGYAVLWAMSLPLGRLLEEHAGLSDAGYVFFITGGLPVVIGIGLFVRFLRTYPLPDEPEARNGEA